MVKTSWRYGTKGRTSSTMRWAHWQAADREPEALSTIPAPYGKMDVPAEVGRGAIGRAGGTTRWTAGWTAGAPAAAPEGLGMEWTQRKERTQRTEEP